MSSRQIVSAALAALVRGDIAAHLIHAADSIVVQINDLPPVQGKVAYQEWLEGLLRSGEAITSFVIANEAPNADGSVTVQVDEDHLSPVLHPGGAMLTQRVTVPGLYIVQEGHIMRVEVISLLAPRRAYRYP